MTFARRASRVSMHPPVVAAAALACTTIGVAMSERPQLVPLLVVASAAVLVASRWRAGVLALVAALPFAGVPALLIGDPGLLAIDLLLVVPLYVAFGVWATRQRQQLLPPLGIAAPALAAFAGLVMVYTSMSPTPLAAAIGIKVWLGYVPMLAVGYCYVRRASDFDAVMRLTALLGLLPAGLALAEWVCATQGGDFGPLERLYATSGLSDTGRFVIFTTGNTQAKIPRVPSLFTSVSQYEGFALVAYAAALSRLFATRRITWCACAFVLALGAIASGARATYVLVPAITAGAMLLSGPRAWHAALLALAAVVGCVGLVAMGVEVLAIARALPGHVAETARTAWSEFSVSGGIFGHGTGWDTNAALRYAHIQDRRYIENWYAKAALETGIPGLIALVLAIGAMLVSLVGRLGQTAPQTRAAAAPLIALLLVVTIALFKGPYIDLQPLSIYFWLFAGMIAALLPAVRGEDGSVPAEVTP